MANPTATQFLSDMHTAMASAITTTGTNPITDAEVAGAVFAGIEYCNNISPTRKIRDRHIIAESTELTFD